MRHKSRPDFDPSKFTPTAIHNKLAIDVPELIDYFETHTLGDCAKKFGCSISIVKRRLRAAGVDTSKHNHSEAAKLKHSQRVAVKKPTEDQLRQLYLPGPEGANWDTKSIAEAFGCHYNVIRSMVNSMGLRRVKSREQISRSASDRHLRKHGVPYPAQRKDVIEKTRRSQVRYRYTDVRGRDFNFRSQHELAYAVWLDSRSLEWYYEEMSIPYVDSETGKRRIYFIDFTVIDGDTVEWIEVKPAEGMIPSDKMIAASRRAEECGAIFRGNTIEERLVTKMLLDSGYRSEFITRVEPRKRAEK